MNEKVKKIITNLSLVAMLLCTIGMLFLINNIKLFSTILLILGIVVIGLNYKERNKYEIGVVIAMSIINLIWMIMTNYTLYLITSLVYILYGVFYLFKNIFKGLKGKIILKIVCIVLLIIPILLNAYLYAVAVNPMVLMGYLQKRVNAVNSYEPGNESTRTVLDNGAIYINDLEYDSDLPNNFFDVYLSPVADENAPTYFYIHGGGYTSGDKVGGDPNTKDDGLAWYFNQFLEAGYNIVTPNYVFTPEYLYPTSLLQLNDCVKYVMEHGSEFGISMDKVIFGGGSAGGNLGGMLALAYTNDKVADNLGIEQYLPSENVKAVVFVSALINNEEYQVSHSPFMDYLFYIGGRVSFNTGFIRGNKIAHDTNIVAWVDENYPPSYISDGNTASFFDQAQALHEKLDELGVVNELSLYPKSVESLFHGFESTESSPSAQDNMKKALKFLDSIINNE